MRETHILRHFGFWNVHYWYMGQLGQITKYGLFRIIIFQSNCIFSVGGWKTPPKPPTEVGLKRKFSKHSIGCNWTCCPLYSSPSSFITFVDSRRLKMFMFFHTLNKLYSQCVKIFVLQNPTMKNCLKSNLVVAWIFLSSRKFTLN